MAALMWGQGLVAAQTQRWSGIGHGKQCSRVAAADWLACKSLLTSSELSLIDGEGFKTESGRYLLL